jgi:hypothetical protein
LVNTASKSAMVAAPSALRAASLDTGLVTKGDASSKFYFPEFVELLSVVSSTTSYRCPFNE